MKVPRGCDIFSIKPTKDINRGTNTIYVLNACFKVGILIRLLCSPTCDIRRGFYLTESIRWDFFLPKILDFG